MISNELKWLINHNMIYDYMLCNEDIFLLDMLMEIVFNKDDKYHCVLNKQYITKITSWGPDEFIILGHYVGY